MYSRKRYSDDAERFLDHAYGRDVEDELGVYNLPPRYDGNRFRRRNTDERCRLCEAETPQLISVSPSESETYELSCDDTAEEDLCKTENDSLFHLFDGIGGEELLIISLILTVAGGEDSGELLMLLILLLLCG